MRQPIWTPYEVAMLIDAYWQIEKGFISKKEAVADISIRFRNHAIMQGQNVDDTFRNENGISIADARTVIAKCINAEPEEIYFTSGGTESDNWAVKGSAFSDPRSSCDDHLSNRTPCRAAFMCCN